MARQVRQIPAYRQAEPARAAGRALRAVARERMAPAQISRD